MEPVETAVSKVDEKEATEAGESEIEDKKKGKKASKKGKKKKEEHETVEILVEKTKHKETEPAIRIHGLRNVKLTSITQKSMGCIVGEHVTAEAPWTTISKKMVDENLYLHHESSDFLPVKDELAEYNDPAILVGYDPSYIPYQGEDYHRFYIAVTESARDEVLNKLEEQKRLAEERLKNSIIKKPYPWKSLGSEAEVDDSIVRNTRPLIQMELETDIDELLKPVKFCDRNIDDAKDGYVRIGPGRHEFKGVAKLRVDAGIQSIPVLLPNSAQTDPGLPTNAWTQYLYDMNTAQEVLQDCQVRELKSDHIFSEQEYLEKTLEYNENFDLYVNDYPLLVLKELEDVALKNVFEEYEAYTDVNHCKNKMISSIAWHPMWSGIVALAYSVAVRCLTASDIELTGDEVNRDVFSKNCVLLWSFKDALKPRLVLESPREVHALSWSPINPNILVGGCASGQIIIWDLKGKLEAVEGHETMTPDQQRYRLVMESLVSWVQAQPPALYVRPAALSNLQFSHAGRVTKIQWIPPTFEWTKNGHLIKIEAEEGKLSMQLLTTGEDGVVMVWDLNKSPEDFGGTKKQRKKKARKRPSALTAQISPFKAYDRKIFPIYMLFPELRGKTATKLTALSFHSKPIKYTLVVPELSTNAAEEEAAEELKIEKSMLPTKSQQTTFSTTQSESGIYESQVGSETELVLRKEEVGESHEVKKKEGEEKLDVTESSSIESITIRKIYRPVLESPTEQPHQLMQVVTDEGESITIKWEGFDFHKGEEITTEQGAIVSWGANVHDGPVVTCVRSPFLEDLILTVGGRVIALWSHQLRDRPLFWKYSPVTVTCGSWSPYCPCIFHVGRSDGSVEVWDFTKCSDSPFSVQSISGKVLTCMSEHSLPLPGNKAILGIADYNNSFRLLHFPEEYKIPRPNELEILKEFVNREVYLRESYSAWNESFIKSHAEELAQLKAKEEEAERLRREPELAAEQEAQMRAKLEEEETKQLAKGKQGNTLSDRFLRRMRQEREKQMQRVLMEKKRLNKTDLIAKQQPILTMKQMEKEKRKKQREKIRHQQKIFDKTVAMLFPEVVEKPKEGLSRMDEFQAQVMQYQPELMAQYDNLLPQQLKLVKDNPFNKRLKWEKVFEEGMMRRNLLDFPLYLRQKRIERYMNSKVDSLRGFYLGRLGGKKGKVGFKPTEEGREYVLGVEEGEEDLEEEEEEEEEEEMGDEEEKSNENVAEEGDGTEQTATGEEN